MKSQTVLKPKPTKNGILTCHIAILRFDEDHLEKSGINKTRVTELAQLVPYYHQLEKEGEDTHFIVKPWNLAEV